MTMEPTCVSLGPLLAHASPLQEGAPGWFGRLRAEAVDRVSVLTVPTTRDEEWRFTDVSPLMRRSFQPVDQAEPACVLPLGSFALPESPVRRVFVDGIHLSELDAGTPEPGARVGSLVETFAMPEAAIASHLGRHAAFHDRVFTALNTAFLRDAAVVHVPRGVRLVAPVHLLFASTRSDAVCHPRCLVIADPGSEITLIEEFAGTGGAACFTNAVTEIAVGADASVTHVRLQRESVEAFHIAHCAVSLGRGARYRAISVAMGAALSRLDQEVLVAGEGGECVLDGFALIDGRQHADTHTCIDHSQRDGTSRQQHKCIVAGAAHAVFNGKIIVRAGAQRTDSAQSSRNLLLSGRARVDTKPQLEIFTDDVKCAHGATVGQLDPEQIFYLRSRGLSEDSARNLLTYAFAAEIVERIPVPSLRARIEAAVLAHTAGMP